MIPQVNTTLRNRIARLVSGQSSAPTAESDSPAFEQIIPDVLHFRAQAERFRQRSIKPHVAILYDEDDSGKLNGLEVPIRADDLGDLSRSYSDAMKALERSGIELKQLQDVSDMEKAFIERLAESTAHAVATSYAQYNGPMVFSTKDTTVISNRSNDTVLYAK